MERAWRVARIAYPSRLARLFRAPRVTFIAVSDAIRNDAIRWGLPPDRVVTQRIGINVDKFHPSGLPIRERERRILFVGRLVEKKGARYLIEAMARVRAQVPDAALTIVGDGPLRASLMAMAESLGVPADSSARWTTERFARSWNAHVCSACRALSRPMAMPKASRWSCPKRRRAAYPS